MARYINGSSAYKIDEYEYRTAAQQREERVKEAPQIQRKYRSLALKICIYVFAVFIMAAGTVYTKVLVMQAHSQVTQLEDELADLIEQNNNKRIEAEQSIDLKKIEQIAITEYGMQRPDKNQTVYVNVVQSDYGEIVKNSQNNKNK